MSETTTPQTVEVSIRGTIETYKTSSAGNNHFTQAVVKSGLDLILCIWKHNNPDPGFIGSQEYIITGQIVERNGKPCMLQPYIESALPETSNYEDFDGVSATEPPRVRSGFRLLKGIATTVVLLVVLGVISSSANSSSAHEDNASLNSSSTTVTGNTVSDTGYRPSTTAYNTNDSLYTNSYTPEYVYTPFDCDYQSVPYSKKTKLDYSLPLGQERISTHGFNGTEKTCYPNGRSMLSVKTVVTQPTDQVTSIGMYVTPTYSPSYLSGLNGYSGYYNVDGSYIPSPNYSGGTIGGYSPTATCLDGTYSYSQHASGTCSGHGGVAY